MVAADIAFHTAIYHHSGNPEIFQGPAGLAAFDAGMHIILSAVIAADIGGT